MIFNGLTENDLGIIIKEPTDIIGRAPLRYEEINIEGADGDQYIELGYSSLSKSIIIQIMDLSKIDLILSTFIGKIRIDYQEKYTYGHFLDAIDVERMTFLRKATINFKRHPFWYAEDEFVVITSSVINSGNIHSKPILRFEKGTSELFDITVGDVRFLYTFLENDTYVDIECEIHQASYDGIRRNRQLDIDFEFPKLMPGPNPITLHSGDPIVKIKRKDRWL